MPRTVSFYDTKRRPVDPLDAIRAEIEANPQSTLARALMQPVDRPAYGGIGEGLARVGSRITGALLEKQQQNKLEKRQSEAQDTIMRALMGEQVDAAPGPPQAYGGGITSQPISRTPNTRADMVSILAGNPDTSNMALNLKMQEMERQRALEDEKRRMAMQQQQWENRFQVQEQARQEAAQRQFQNQMQLRQTPAARAPVPGVDVPFSEEVQEQRIQSELAKIQAKAAVKGPQLTPGQKKIDETAAKDLAPFVVGGGFADVQKGLAQLRKVIGELEEGSVTGTSVGFVPNAVLSIFNERAVDTQNLVEEVVQRNLRTILGAQFTEKEGTRLIERAYNPYLREEKNKPRVEALIRSIEQAAQAKKEAWDYLQEHGTLKGFDGKLWSMQDFERAVEEADENGDDEKEGTSDVDDLVNKYRSR